MIVRRQHPVALTLTRNSAVMRLRRAIAEGASREVLASLDMHVARATARREAAIAGDLAPTLTFSPRPQRDRAESFPPFDGPVAILTDDRCGSSGEHALELLKQLPRSRTFGRSSAGALHFGQAGRLVLPHSKIIVTIATQYVRYDDGVFREKVGFAPDHLVSTGGDAMDAALAWLAGELPRKKVR